MSDCSLDVTLAFIAFFLLRSVKTIYTIVVRLHIAVNTVVLYLYCLSNANDLILYSCPPLRLLRYSVHGVFPLVDSFEEQPPYSIHTM